MFEKIKRLFSKPADKICPVCGKYKFKEASYEICPVCGWEDDPVQRREPDFKGGANVMSLNEAREAYQAKADCKAGGADEEN